MTSLPFSSRRPSWRSLSLVAAAGGLSLLSLTGSTTATETQPLEKEAITGNVEAGPVAYRKEYQWGLYCDQEPVDSLGKPVSQGFSEVSVQAANGAEIATLRIDVAATRFPDHATVLTAAEAAAAKKGLPASKVVLEQNFCQTGHLTYDGATLAFMHPDDIRIPAKGEAATVCVNLQLEFYRKDTAVWKEGDAAPPAPASPALSSNPANPSARNQSAGGNGLAFLADWSEQGWIWTAAAHPPASNALTRAYLDSWKPAAEQAKTENVSLRWSMKRCVRSRTVQKKDTASAFTPVNPAKDGWSEWLPD